jgi:hypothetical protein
VGDVEVRSRVRVRARVSAMRSRVFSNPLYSLTSPASTMLTSLGPHFRDLTAMLSGVTLAMPDTWYACARSRRTRAC